MINKVILYQQKPQEIQHCSMLKVGLNNSAESRTFLRTVDLGHGQFGSPVVQFELYDIILIENGSYRNVMQYCLRNLL
jgi:hypothetical protein